MGIVVAALVLTLMVASVVDVIRRPDDEVRYLPKAAWVIIIVMLSPLGAVAWWAVGRAYPRRLHVQVPRPRNARPATPAPPTPSVDTRSTEQQIADLDREIEEWRLREEIAKRERPSDEPPNSLGE